MSDVVLKDKEGANTTYSDVYGVRMLTEDGNEVTFQLASDVTVSKNDGVTTIDIKDGRGNTQTAVINDGYTPVKGVDYFDGDTYKLTDEDKQDIANLVDVRVPEVPTRISDLENDSGYITDRHGLNPIDYEDLPDGYAKREVTGSTTLLNSVSLTLIETSSNLNMAIYSCDTVNIVPGKAYSVTVDDITVKCVADSEGFLGEAPLYVDNGEHVWSTPFYITTDAIMTMIMLPEGTTASTITIVELETAVTPFDENFIPDSIARANHTHDKLSSLTIIDELTLQNEYDDASFVKIVATDSEGDEAANAIKLFPVNTDSGEVNHAPVEVQNVATPVLDNDAANKKYVDQSRVTKVSQLENDSGFLTSPLSYEDMPDGYATASGANTVVYSDEHTGYMLTQSTAVLPVSSFEIEDGQLYEVFINGETYRCHAVTLAENCITLGSVPTTEDGSFTGEEEYPFGVVVDTVNNSGSVIWYHTEEDGEPEIIFSATKIERVVTPFNEEFIPDTIARKSDIPQAISKISELTNDSNFQTYEQVQSAINTAISSQTHFTFMKVDILPSVGEDNVIYLVPKTSTLGQTFEEYLYLSDIGSFELIGSTDIDLSGYALKEEIPGKISDLENDANYISKAELQNILNQIKLNVSEDGTISINIPNIS